MLIGNMCDGIGHYGTDVDLMLEGPYLSNSGCLISTENPRTGQYHLRMQAENDGGPRWSLGGSYTECGIGYAVFMPNLPSNSASFCFASFRTSDNSPVLSLVLSATGEVIAQAGAMGGGELGRSSAVFNAGAYQHFECNCVFDGSAGAVEVRINEVTVLNLTGLSITGPVSQVLAGSPGEAITGFPTWVDFADLYSRDTAGDFNNTFIGDKRVTTRFPNADTAQADWLPPTGSDAAEQIASNPPDDVDKWIEAGDVGDISVFGIEALGEGIVSIAAIVAVTRAYKTDTGSSSVQPTIISDTATSAGAEHSTSPSGHYYIDLFETDPDTDSLWTPSAASTLQYQIERTV